MCYRQSLSAVLCLLFYLITGLVMAQGGETIPLPVPAHSGQQSLETLLQQRRSRREYTDAGLSLAEVGQLLWAAQGITDARGHRTAPSAGALYPLELYLVATRVDGLAHGVYHYHPQGHSLGHTAAGDVHDALATAARSQSAMQQAAAVVVFTAVPARTEKKYGKRARRYVDIEVGHAAENLFLQAGSLGLATVVVGAFDDRAVTTLLHLPAGQEPLLLMPIGRD